MLHFLAQFFLTSTQSHDSFSPRSRKEPCQLYDWLETSTDLQFFTILISLSVNLYSSRAIFVFFTATITADLKSICNHLLLQDVFQQYQTGPSNFYLCIWLSFFLNEEFCNCLLISAHYSNHQGQFEFLFCLLMYWISTQFFSSCKFDKEFFPSLKLLKNIEEQRAQYSIFWYLCYISLSSLKYL